MVFCYGYAGEFCKEFCFAGIAFGGSETQYFHRHPLHVQHALKAKINHWIVFFPLFQKEQTTVDYSAALFSNFFVSHHGEWGAIIISVQAEWRRDFFLHKAGNITENTSWQGWRGDVMHLHGENRKTSEFHLAQQIGGINWWQHKGSK